MSLASATSTWLELYLNGVVSSYKEVESCVILHRKVSAGIIFLTLDR